MTAPCGREAVPASLSARLAAARGMAVVPVVPTDTMLDRAGDAIIREFNESDWDEAKEMAERMNARPIWDAMLAAAEAGEARGG